LHDILYNKLQNIKYLPIIQSIYTIAEKTKFEITPSYLLTLAGFHFQESRVKLFKYHGVSLGFTDYPIPYTISYCNIFAIEDIIKNSVTNLLLFSGDEPKDPYKLEFIVVNYLKSATNLDAFGRHELFNNIDILNLSRPYDRVLFYLNITDENPKIVAPNVDATAKNRLNDVLQREVSMDIVVLNTMIVGDLTKEELYYQKNICTSGIFELSLMYRQSFETPDKALRFLTLLDTLEVSTTYLVSIIYSLNQNGLQFSESFKFEELENLTFGTSNRILREWLKFNYKFVFNEHIILENILNSKIEPNDSLSKLIEISSEELKLKFSISKSPNVIDILDFFAAIRNKTRGHGTVHKISYELLIHTIKITLMILNKINSMDIELFTVFESNHSPYIMNIKSGGCPFLFSTNTAKEVYINPYIQEESKSNYQNKLELFLSKMINLDKYKNKTVIVSKSEHIWDISSIIKYHKGNYYLFSSKTKNKSLYISHTSGQAISPRYDIF
jgi:hypothetical protein